MADDTTRETLSIRFSAAERSQINRAARHHGVPVSTYVRECAVQAAEAVPKEAAAELARLNLLVGEAIRLGNWSRVWVTMDAMRHIFTAMEGHDD